MSRDTRTQELQQITRVSANGRTSYLEDDEPCVRNIDWMLFILNSPNMEAAWLLEAAQEAFKGKRAVDPTTDKQITCLMVELDKASRTLTQRLTAELEGPASLLGQAAAENIHASQSGPQKSLFKVSRNDADIDLERWHLLLACWATCRTLFTAPCNATPFIGLGERGRLEYARCIYDELLGRSLLTLNLVYWALHQPGARKPIDLRHIHTIMPLEQPTESEDPVTGDLDIEPDVKKSWLERMLGGREACCHAHLKVENILLEHLWRSLAAEAREAGAKEYKEAEERRKAPSDLVDRNSGTTAAHGNNFQSTSLDNETSAAISNNHGLENNSSGPSLGQHCSIDEPPNKGHDVECGVNPQAVKVWRRELLSPEKLLEVTTDKAWPSGETEKLIHLIKVHYALFNIRPETDLRDYCFKNVHTHKDPRMESHWKKSYIVVGWFPGTLVEPIEACMWYFDEQEFLPSLKRQIAQLRGWRQFLSLKTVQAFGLYKVREASVGHTKEAKLMSSECDLEHRCHTNYQCTPSEKTILAQLYNACYRHTLSRQRDESIEWADWVQLNLNNNTDTPDGRLLPLPFQCHRSLKLIVKWSRVRLILAASVPLLLSLCIGLWYQFKIEDVQTAYTIASYIMTAGACK